MIDFVVYKELGGTPMYTDEFEFPNDSPKEEIVKRLMETGLSHHDALFLLLLYNVEEEEKRRNKILSNFLS